jgi:mannose-6-phosphate isomerase-like protein (cupin superfamily)|tara:strand:- start:1211 stop:1516 length:306 start_codon:yes stop_codon:yes gene_type:complete
MVEMVNRAKFPQPVDRDAVERSWRDRGYDCHTFNDPPGQQWNDFVHRTNELVTVVEGELELEIEGETCTAGPGDEVFIPRDAVHSVRNIHAGRTRWFFGYD